jgi:hypothetical protein
MVAQAMVAQATVVQATVVRGTVVRGTVVRGTVVRATVVQAICRLEAAFRGGASCKVSQAARWCLEVRVSWDGPRLTLCRRK